ncbi:MAG: hypothetical protein A2W93_14165 [Bacteroidetes bacterium GWF2_43_63]|nr:MAG: hypothetical protein A2W93_14165 [Bacteroidetes bacterium GWF2_43_63]
MNQLNKTMSICIFTNGKDKKRVALCPQQDNECDPCCRAQMQLWLLGEGVFKVKGFFAGYITVKKKYIGGYSVMWTTGKDTHNPFGGPAYYFEILQDRSIKNTMQSALTFHPDNESEREETIEILFNKIDRAFQKQFGKVKTHE